MNFSVTHTGQLPEVASEILANFAHSRVFLFFGEMGAGKTTFIKEICRHLGVVDPVASPTYSIINEYPYPNGLVYHFDFYRLKNQTEALDLGCEEYFYSGQYCFIEWPENISLLWPQAYVKINLQVLNDEERQIAASEVKI